VQLCGRVDNDRLVRVASIVEMIKTPLFIVDNNILLAFIQKLHALLEQGRSTR
jgi:hypothetical protein